MNTLINNLMNDITSYPQKPKASNRIKDSGDVYSAEFELAGFCKKDVVISVIDSVLTVKAKNEDRSRNYELYLYDLVSEDHISASLKNGMLDLTLPKKAVKGAKKIELK
tara:strand:+ start:1658 stop:1984 length:327 start_codon:yes stop_codon:yes gene_type:complete